LIESECIEIFKLREIYDSLPPDMDLDELYKSVVFLSKKILNCEESSLLLYDERKNVLSFKATTDGKMKDHIGISLPENSGFAWDVVRKKDFFYSNDVKQDPRFYKEIDEEIGFSTKNILCCPMIVNDELVGVLELVNSIDRDNFSDYDQAVATVLSKMAASSISNRMLYEKLNKRVEELTTLFELSKIALYVDNNSLFFKSVVEIISKCLNVDRVSIMLHNRMKNRLEIAATYGLDIPVGTNVRDDSVSAYVFKKMEPLFVNDPEMDIPEGVEVNFRGYRNQSFISVPIMFNSQCMGVLNLTDKKSRNYFDEFELQVLSTLGHQIAGVFQSYNMKIEEEKRKRLKQELFIAADIQRRNLARIPKDLDRVEIVSLYEPAKDVGGDFFDFYRCVRGNCPLGMSENRISIVIADVSGKGIPAAIFTGTVKNILRAQSRVRCCSELFTLSNDFIYEESEYGMFVTAFFANIDMNNRIIRYSSAGHNDQMLIKRESKVVLKLKAGGKPLGIIEGAGFDMRQIDYAPGDILVLFTDGLVETLGGEKFDPDLGFDRLSEIILNNLDLDFERLLNVIRNEVRNSYDESELFDDLTTLIIKLK